MALLYIVKEKFSKGSIQNRNKTGNIWENFQKWVGGTKFWGEIPKFYLEIGSRWGVGPGFKFFLVLINTLTCTIFKFVTPKSISLPITHKICFFKNLIVPNFLPRGGRNFILLCSQLHGVPNFFYLFFILKSPISRPLVYEILFPQLKYMLT